MKVTPKQAHDYEATEYQPIMGEDGRPVFGGAGGGVQASHGQSVVLYLEHKGKRVEVNPGDFLVRDNGVLHEILKPAEFHEKYEEASDASKEQEAAPTDGDRGASPGAALQEK